MSRIFHKILATGRPVAKTLLKYNSYRLEENDEEENESINIELKYIIEYLVTLKMECLV